MATVLLAFLIILVNLVSFATYCDSRYKDIVQNEKNTPKQGICFNQLTNQLNTMTSLINKELSVHLEHLLQINTVPKL